MPWPWPTGGRAHRFAGSGDRAQIGNIVYDVLRKRQSLAARMGDDLPRALVIATAPATLSIPPDDVIALADGSRHALSPLSQEEISGLRTSEPDSNAPSHVYADVPEWLMPSLTRAFGERAVAESKSLAERAPLDLRVNLLKADQEKVLKALEHTGAAPTPLSPVGIRIPAAAGSRRLPNVEAEASHGKGWFEVQDEGSQIAALLARANPREQVLDLCAGAGGKTLALGARMQNTGQLYAYDRDKSQLRPIFERLKRAGVRNVQVMDAGDEAALDALAGRFDLVLADAPCTGVGTWRRRPDIKWRVKPENLQARITEQRAVLERAAIMVRPGGRLVYVTCSLLPEENTDQVAWFLNDNPEFALAPYRDAWQEAIQAPVPHSADGDETTLLLTPACHGTDGFFVALMERRATA